MDWKERQADRLRVVAQKEARLKELWEQHPDLEIRISFSCGGDSMSDLYINWHDTKDVPQEVLDEIKDIAEDIVYDKVEFYVNSDGHYCGESGEVILEIDEDGFLQWYKDAEAEFSENVSIDYQIDLAKEGFTKEEIDYLEEVVAGVIYSEWGDDITFRKDIIVLEKQHSILTRFNAMLKRIDDENTLLDLAVAEGEREYNGFTYQDDSATLCTDESLSLGNESTLTIKDNILTIYYDISGYVYVPSDW